MNGDLKIDPALYGLATGIFFVGYFLFEVPSNLLLQRLGARTWLSRIMITWGLVSAAMAFVHGHAGYVWMRFALGVAEAGFFPGVILYLTYWFPAPTRARMMAMFVAAIPLSSVIGAPVSNAILNFNGVLGLRGWQWLFLLEGAPAVALGLATPFLLSSRPTDAAWLSSDERAALDDVLSRETRRKAHMPLGRALVHPVVLLLSVVYFCMMIGLYVMSYWLPRTLKGMGVESSHLGWMVAIPYAAGALVMIPWGRHADATGEREGHVAIAMLGACAGFIMAALCHGVAAVLAGWCLVSMGVFCAMPAFWAIPTLRLAGTAAAGGIALVNSLGNLGGFAGSATVGKLAERANGSIWMGLLLCAAVMNIGGAVMLWLKPAAPEPWARVSNESAGPVPVPVPGAPVADATVSKATASTT
jgi:ACS family tartrate transporter-like MFS transporter